MKEAGISWTKKDRSSVHLVRDSIRVFTGLIRIRRNSSESEKDPALTVLLTGGTGFLGSNLSGFERQLKWGERVG